MIAVIVGRTAYVLMHSVLFAIDRLEMSKADVVDNCRKWQIAYQTLSSVSDTGNNQTMDELISPISSRLGSCDPDTRDSGARDLCSPDESIDILSQVTSQSLINHFALCRGYFYDPRLSAFNQCRSRSISSLLSVRLRPRVTFVGSICGPNSSVSHKFFFSRDI